MIRVERATPADADSVLPLLAHFENPAVLPAHWRSLFHPPWECGSDLRGFVLRDGERTVGFFGAIPSTRRIGGREEHMANLTSWIALPEYRNHSIRLFQAVATIEGHTLTCMTPLASTHPFYMRFGFQNLESHLRILLPVPSPAALRFRTTTSPRTIAARARGEAAEVFASHGQTPCRHILVERGDRQCLVVLSRTKGRRYHFARIHGFTDGELFVEAIEAIRWRAMLAAGAPLVMLDRRWLPRDPIRWSRTVPIAQVPVFKSSTLEASQIDSLFSEMVLLPL